MTGYNTKVRIYLGYLVDGAYRYNGDYFSGPVDKKGRPNGKGEIIYPDGDRYLTKYS